MKNAFFYFIVFPFYGLIQAMKNYKLPWAKNMVWLFVVFYGYTMFRPIGMDSSRYVLKLQDIVANPRTMSSFIDSFFSTDSEGNVTFDLYEPLMTNFVSLFTDNGNILFAFFGLIFGYFYSRNIWFLLDESKEEKQSKVFWLLIFVFVVVIGFWELNGVRMWTAAHVFFYGVYNVIIKDDRKGIFYILTSALIHFSFAMPILVFFLYYIVHLPLKLTFILFITSFFISSLNVSDVGLFLENTLPEVLLPKVKSYTGDEYVEIIDNLNQSANWYIQYFGKGLNYSIAFLMTVIYFSKNNNYKKEKSFINLMSFSLLILTVGNLLSSLPSGGRYLLLAQLFGTAVLILFFLKFYSMRYQRAVYFCSPFLLLFILISVRKSFDTVSVMTVFTNPLLASIIDTPIPLIDLIK